MPRNACVIQITPVRLTKTSANDASVVRKMYLSIDPIAYRTIPTSQLNAGSRPIPDAGSPLVAPSSASGSVTHYHPFDPSTKWLRHGAVNIQLIIRALWRSCHAGAWQRGGCRVIVTVGAMPRRLVAG